MAGANTTGLMEAHTKAICFMANSKEKEHFVGKMETLTVVDFPVDSVLAKAYLFGLKATPMKVTLPTTKLADTVHTGIPTETNMLVNGKMDDKTEGVACS